MGSGCTSGGSSSSMRPTADTSVVYTGIGLPALGICTGDTLAEVDAVILQQIVNYSTGVGISLPSIDITRCACFTAKVSCCGAVSCQTLTCVLQAYLDCMCEIYGDVQTLKTSVASLNGPYTTGCLSVAPGSTLPVVMQELITEFCTLVSTVAALQTQVNSLSTGLTGSIGTFLSGALQTCQTGGMTKSGTGAGFTATFAGFCPIGTVVMYGGTLAGKFDSSGLGINPGPACGWALCNGGNGTVDMRGYFPVGVNDGTMGSASQNPEVDNAVNPGQNYTNNSHAGQIQHQLTSAEIPTASISGTSSFSGSATITLNVARNQPGSNLTHCPQVQPGTQHQTPPGTGAEGSVDYPVNIAGTSSVTGSVGGGNGKHENRPPYRALYFIQRVS